jgi:restriction system protein
MEFLNAHPQRIDLRYLSQFPEFVQFREVRCKDRNGPVEQEPEAIVQQAPAKMLQCGNQRIRQDLAQELLARVKSCSSAFFERLVVELLVKMGYGGSRRDAGEAVGRSGDEGIDGIIKEEKLGLDVIYIQAKRWQGVVGRPEIQTFVGALHGQRARKGIFITTSDFSREAREYATNIESKVVLIDGAQLSQLMIDTDVGVSRATACDNKRIDSDYRAGARKPPASAGG